MKNKHFTLTQIVKNKNQLTNQLAEASNKSVYSLKRHIYKYLIYYSIRHLTA
ncbi:hypothetical protein SAMN04489724_2429 [Algoriphagus locisalis]|uniref:Uncharacterized protein n=1 Tax=Algoriphagus locisalis TaxID=305507 RepID=A0A1I7BHG3_9BACT|nr:hypothetical protein SAMN04489724_2429 [Algoriphagus locisalis]